MIASSIVHLYIMQLGCLICFVFSVAPIPLSFVRSLSRTCSGFLAPRLQMMVEIESAPVYDSSPVNEKGDISYVKDPEAYVYQTSSSPNSGSIKGAVSKDGSIDPEQGEITADTTLDTTLQLVTKTLDITDDPTESPYTFRSFFIGLGLAAFGAVIAEIFYFKPQTVVVNVIFLQIIAFVLGEATTLIPQWGKVGRFINPGPFNQKEHVFVTILASSGATSALGTEQLAVQSL